MLNFPKRRRIYLMRHAEAAYVAEDGTVTSEPRLVPLTSQGRQQADQQGQALADIAFDQVICSGLPRTVETAQRVLAQSSHAQPHLQHLSELEEIHGLSGDRQWPPAANVDVAELLADMANPWAKGAQPGARFLGGELFSDFANRVERNWQAVVAREDWQTLLVVAHGAVNRMIFNLVLGINWRADLCIEQDNGCINIIDVDDITPPRYLIRCINLTSYNLSKEQIHLTNLEATAQRVAQTLTDNQV